MSASQRFRLALACSIFAAGAVFLIISVNPFAHNVRSDNGTTSDLDGDWLINSSPARMDAPTASAALRAALAAHADTSSLTSAQTSSLVEHATDRIALLLDPDFDRLQSHLRRWTGVSPGSPPTQQDREQWLAFAGKYSNALIDPHHARVIVRWSSGKRVSERRCNGSITAPTAGYGPLIDPQRQRLTAVDVLIPVDVSDVRSGAPIRASLVVMLAWNDSLSQWQPLGMGICGVDVPGAIPPSPPY